MATAPTRVSPDDLDTQVFPPMLDLDATVPPEPEPLVDDETASQMRNNFQHGRASTTLSSIPSATSLEPTAEAADPEPPQEASRGCL